MCTEGSFSLKRWRNEKGLTQSQLGELVGLSQEWISRLETDTLPSLAKAVRIFHVTGIEPASWFRKAKKS